MKRTSKTLLLFLLCLAYIGSPAAVTPTIAGGLKSRFDEQRIKTIAAMLSEHPAGFGRPINDRAAWEKLVAREAFQKVIRQAEQYLTRPIPEMSDEVFRESAITGNRRIWSKVNSPRRNRIEPLVLAECLENKGRFMSAIEKTIREICGERTWVHPAHDRKLDNFERRTIDIDLRAAALAWRLATACYLLGDKLNPETRRLLHDNLHRRIFDPCRDMAAGKRKPNGWMSTKTNNWVPVCLSGVTGSALAVIESRQERAWFIAAAEVYIKNFFKGFTDHGYCSEGVGYWHYGFRHFLLMAEAIYQATGGGVDMLDNGTVRAPATYGARIEIINGIYPTFSDCQLTAEPGPRPMYYVSRRFGLGLRRWEEQDMAAPEGFLYDSMMYSFPNSASQTPIADTPNEGPRLRSWFPDAGVLIGRPAEGSSCRLGVAMKGAHNHELHNHNDVGSFVAVVGKKMLLVDPGAEIYTGRTFSKHRYESKVLNSFGHPVPIVAGQLQKTGKEARGEVIKTNFTNEADTLVLDMRSAYDVPELEKLERTFAYSRQGRGSLTVTDKVVFTEPRNFGIALITFDQWEEFATGSLLVYDNTEAVQIDISVTGSNDADSDFQIRTEEIHEKLKTKTLPTRLGINMKQPVTKAVITTRITPVSSKP